MTARSDPRVVRVSVVIPTHNFGRFIEEAVASVLAQGIEELELIVVDDASADDTLERLARITDRRLRVETLAKVGVGAARNHGLQVARGTHVAFLDADDRWRPGKLSRQLEIVDSEPDVGFVFTNFERFDEHGVLPQTQFDLVPELRAVPARPTRAGGGRMIEADTFLSLAPVSQHPCWVQTMLVRADVARRLAFPVDMRLSQDLYYVLRLYAMARAAYIDEPLVDVRRHAGNSYQRAYQKLEPDIEALTRVEHEMTNPLYRATIRRRLGRAWLGLGYHQFWRGKWHRAARAYVHALRFPGTVRTALVHLVATPIAPWLRYRRARRTTPPIPPPTTAPPASA